MDKELLEFIKYIHEISGRYKELSRSQIKEYMKLFHNELDRYLYSSCQARLPGGSAICNRPSNHSGPHRQEAIEWGRGA